MDTPSNSRLLLPDHHVHVWRTELAEESATHQLESLLSQDEIARADRFRFLEHRRRFVIARGCLRQLLAAHLGIEARRVVFAYTAEGKHHLAPEHRSKLRFNVSHSGDIAVFAFTVARNIGVDVEVIRYDVDVDEIPKRFFSSTEQQSLAGLHGEEKYRAFFDCWTRKEAYVKAVGSGLSLPLRDFDVSLLPGAPARLLASRPDPSLAAKWSMASLDFGEACAAAVVVEGQIERLEVWCFNPS